MNEKRKTGKIAKEIKNIQVKENLTLPELFEKYPHLAKLQLEELLEEKEEKQDKKLLLD
jgi:hypothetical protein|tara:strand:- start:4083 stop:4259 length:177 start_codon:yes stop_codon:yes gene_type:complete